jgi:hypothetical protein
MWRKQMSSNKLRNEFRVLIEGIALPASIVSRINEALQKAVLIEMASVNLRDSELTFSPVMAQMVSDDEPDGNGGTTGGAQIRIVSRT